MTPMNHSNTASPSPHLRIVISYFLCPIQIRERSSLEKVFAYFSSAAQDNARYMLPQDLVHALVPTYPPLESSIERAGRLDGGLPSGAAHACACGAVLRDLLPCMQRPSGPGLGHTLRSAILRTAAGMRMHPAPRLGSLPAAADGCRRAHRRTPALCQQGAAGVLPSVRHQRRWHNGLHRIPAGAHAAQVRPAGCACKPPHTCMRHVTRLPHAAARLVRCRSPRSPRRHTV